MDIGEAARLIEANSDFRLLRRVPAAADWVLPEVLGETRRGVFVDTETTGLDLESDEVIELALLPFEYERETGRIVSVDHAGALSMFRQPLKPIPAGSTLIHGISDAMVAGRVIDEALVRAIVEPAHIILAHNAGFDRPMWKSIGRCLRTSTGLVLWTRSIGAQRALDRPSSIISYGRVAGFMKAIGL